MLCLDVGRTNRTLLFAAAVVALGCGSAEQGPEGAGASSPIPSEKADAAPPDVALPEAGPTDACDARTVLEFRADAPAPGSEAYVCFGFPVASLAAGYIRAIEWIVPNEGAVRVHHAGIYASPLDALPEPTACDAMPDGSFAMHVWGPGSDPMRLPADAGVVLPDGTKSIIVQAHALRLDTGAPELSRISLCTVNERPSHAAAWLRAFGAVPALLPHSEASGVARCRAALPLHVFSTRPHMHKLGTKFEGTIVRSGGAREPLVAVRSWDFDSQATYLTSVDLLAGDTVETACTWSNVSDLTVGWGLKSSDEMCHQGMVVWPIEAAYWDGPCQ